MNKYIYSLSTLRLLRHIEIELYRQEGGGGVISFNSNQRIKCFAVFKFKGSVREK